MKKVALTFLLLFVCHAYAQTVSCPATHEGKKLTNVVFDEWESNSPSRSMALDRKTLMPDESRVDGNDWFQSWDVRHAISGNGLQMICQYQGLPAGLFIELKERVSVCTMMKKAGKVTAECK